MEIYFICIQIVDLCGFFIQNLAQKSDDLVVGDMHGFARKIRKIEALAKMDNFLCKKQIWMGKHEKIS